MKRNKSTLPSRLLSLALLLSAILVLTSFILCLSSCIDAEDTFGINIAEGSIETISTERINGNQYEAHVRVNFPELELAGLEFDEAGIVVTNENTKQQRTIPLTYSLSKLSNIDCTISDLSYDNQYVVNLYYITHLKDQPEKTQHFSGVGSQNILVHRYEHLAIASITATSKSEHTLTVAFELNDDEINKWPNRVEITICPAILGKVPEPGHPLLQTAYDPSNNTFTFQNLGINQDYYVFASFQVVFRERIYSDTIRVHIPGKGHETDCAVDLGLSVLWSSHNLGAERPEMANWDMQGAKYYVNNHLDRIEWQWSNGWRRPTLAEFDELFRECTVTYEKVNQWNVARIVGPNGNSILLPLAQYSCTSPTPENDGYQVEHDSWGGGFPLRDYLATFRGVREKTK